MKYVIIPLHVAYEQSMSPFRRRASICLSQQCAWSKSELLNDTKSRFIGLRSEKAVVDMIELSKFTVPVAIVVLTMVHLLFDGSKELSHS